jgi:hypothetical protein
MTRASRRGSRAGVRPGYGETVSRGAPGPRGFKRKLRIAARIGHSRKGAVGAEPAYVRTRFILGHQLDRADAGSWLIADGGAHGSGSSRARFVVEP